MTLLIAPSEGPPDPAASRPLSGLWTATPLRFTATGSPGTLLRAVVHVDVDLGTHLEFALYPDSHPDDPFAATGVAIDALFDDGTRRSDRGGVDQYGIAMRADATEWAYSLVPDQWNARRIDLRAVAGRSIVSVELAVTVGRTGTATGYLDRVRVTRAGGTALLDGRSVQHPLSPADLVLTTRGSHSTPRASRGNTFPAVGLPHGFTFATPVTDARDDGWIYSWHAHDVAPGRTPLQAVAISHLASPWMRDHGVLQLIPHAAAGPASPPLTFSHENETARPHRYEVITDQGVGVAVAPADHAVLFEFRYPGSERVLSIDSISRAGRLDIEGDSTFGGWIDTPGKPRLYFSGRADAAVTDTSSVEHGVPAAVIRFTDGDDPVRVSIGASFIDVEQADRALQHEIAPGDTIDQVAERARSTWNELLGRVTVEGASDDQLVTLYSNLYRLALYPNSASENTANGEMHRDPTTGAVTPGTLTVNNGFWDTYRTAWPALSLLDPRTGGLLDGFVRHFASTGWMPRWSAPAAEDCMVGTSSDIVFADAVVSGIDDFDGVAAFDSALRNALTAPPRSAVGRADSDSAVFAGYASTRVAESVSWSVENSLNDFGIARMASALAERSPRHPRLEEFETAAEYFARRALGYRTLFDSGTGFFRGRDADGGHGSNGHSGDAADFDPRRWGHDYAETNAWGTAFSAPHDGAGLAALFGGRAGLEAKLDEFFATPETGDERWRGSYPGVIHEMTEARDIRLGMFGLSNQPAHHIPFMYLFTDAPHKAEAITREALRRCFTGSDIGQGYPGDEDNGELSAWWLFAAMGLYPLAPASGGLVVGSPLFERMTLRLAEGATLTVIAQEQSAVNVHVQSLTIDGEPWSSRFVPLPLIVAGATIAFTMGPRPANWSHTPPPSLSDDPGLAPLVDLASLGTATSSHGEARLVVDDESTRGIRLPEDGWVRVDLAAPAAIGLYTVTSTAGERMEWELEGLADDGWRPLDSRRGDMFRWDRETRVFRADSTHPVTSVRLRVRHPLDLRQLELFDSIRYREDHS